MNPLRTRIASEVRRMFAAPGGRPAVVPAPPDQRLLPQGSVSFDVHADVTTMMIGGISALLLQMLHPAALAGVWDFSNFRNDMAGRLQRTAAFIAATSFASASDADAAIARVRRIHAKVRGTLPDGCPYHADDPRLLAFVGVTEALSFLAAWRRYREPAMRLHRQDRYIAEQALIAERLGAAPMPRTRRAAEALLATCRQDLKADARTREVAGLILSARPSAQGFTIPRRLIRDAAIDLLPPWARQMHGLTGQGLPAPVIHAGASGLSALLNWALAPGRAQPEQQDSGS